MIDVSMHDYFMLLALRQAEKGRGCCSPNPSVGAVAVVDGQVVAKAYHQGAGTPHAEQLVLAKVAAGIKNLSLYITLEPCNHWGRTPPCIEAIVRYGVKEVIYGYTDPNPVVAINNSPAQLEARGVNVVHWSMKEIDRFYQSYRYWTLTKQPWVTAKLAHTLDGKIGSQEGDRLILSNDACTQFTHEQRLCTDIILTSARTVQRDDPALNVRLGDVIEEKCVAILDAHLSLNGKEKIFSTAKHCHVYFDAALAEQCQNLANCTYHPVRSVNGQLDLKAILNHLGGMGYHDVWIEAGGRLFSAFHAQRLVHRTYLYLVPAVLGEGTTTGFHGKGLFNAPKTITWQIKSDNVIACLDWQHDR